MIIRKGCRSTSNEPFLRRIPKIAIIPDAEKHSPFNKKGGTFPDDAVNTPNIDHIITAKNPMAVACSFEIFIYFPKSIAINFINLAISNFFIHKCFVYCISTINNLFK